MGRVPWWFYAAVFVIIAGVAAANDFVRLTGTRLIALLIVVAVAGMVATARVRGGRPRPVNPWLFGGALLAAGLFGWVVVRYEYGSGANLADRLGVHNYPHTAAGLISGTVVTLMLAMINDLVRRPAG